MRRAVIAIDGPAGAGKSTASRMLAERLGYVLVDTGALYRGIALAAREQSISWDDAEGLGQLAERLDLSFDSGPGGEPLLKLDGRDRSREIRTPEMSQGASLVSRHPQVRAALLEAQRKLGEEGGVVLEGRDIGTVVFPNADLKVFLTASAEIRAERRVADLASRGIAVDYAKTLSEIRQRDRQDSEREVAPLKPAPDAVTVDSSGVPLVDVVAHLVRLASAL